MVGHQAITDETHARRALPGLAQELDKGGVIAFLVKHRAATVAPVEDVVAETALGRAWATWHTTDYRRWGRDVKKKCTLSPLCAVQRRRSSVGAIPTRQGV